MALQIQWRDNFSVGFEPIDAQHKLLIKMINDIYVALETNEVSREKIDHFLDMLLLYTETHFEYEEKIMKFAGFNGHDKHARVHQEMILRTQGLSLAMDVDPGEHMHRLLKVLVDWLINHIIIEDQQYAEALRTLEI